MIAESMEIVIHLQKDKRVYRFAIPYGAPYVESHEVLKELGDHINQIQAKAKEAAEQEEAKKKDLESGECAPNIEVQHG